MALTQVSTGGIKDGQVHTADLADAQITAGKLHADALDRTYTLGASGSNHYTFTGEGLTGAVNDPTLYLTRGKTYRFVNGNSAGAHPFRIQTTVNGSAGTEYNTGVTNNGGAGGSTIVFEVPHDAPDVLYYQCTSHGSMGGILYVTGALSDGSVTTAKLADDAVTGAKIADDAVGTVHIAAQSIGETETAPNAITTTKIANDAVTTIKIADDAITDAKLANSINSAIAANTAKDLTALSASNLTSGTVPDARFPAALPAVSGANLTNLPASGQAHNHIHNGAMTVAQRGVAHQNVGNNASTYTLDRWKLYVQNSSARFQIEQNTDHSLPDGFSGSMRISCTTTDTSLAATDEVYLTQSIEGQDLMAFAKGTPSAKQYTLSFYARSDKTGTYCVTLLTPDNTAGTISKSYTMTNTWTRHVITFPADTNSSRKINNDNGEGLRIMWWLVAGSGVNNGTLQTTWTNSTDTGRATGQVNFADSTNEFYITGVQLEAGDTASDFAYESVATTLQKCQRYFVFHDDVGGSATAYNAYSDGYRWWVPFNPPMRVNPTVTTVDGNDGGSNATFNVYSPKATGYQARIESTTTSSSQVWMVSAEVRASADF